MLISELEYKVFVQALVDRDRATKRHGKNSEIIKEFIREIKKFNDKREKTISEARYSIVEHRTKAI